LSVEEARKDWIGQGGSEQAKVQVGFLQANEYADDQIISNSRSHSDTASEYSKPQDWIA